MLGGGGDRCLLFVLVDVATAEVGNVVLLSSLLQHVAHLGEGEARHGLNFLFAAPVAKYRGRSAF